MSAYRFGLTAAAVLFAIVLVGGLGATPAASAAITGSSITTPSDPSFFIADYDAASQTFAISGTSDGTTGDQVDINCYYGTTWVSVATGVSLNADGSFSVPDAQVGNIEDQVCTLRAVPAGTTPSDLSPYAGPRIGVGSRFTQTVSGGPNDGQAYDYFLYAQQLTGAFDYASLGSCGLERGYLFDSTFNPTTTTFFCNAALYNYESYVSPTRSELQIDGVDAYTPDTAGQINAGASGLPALSYSYSVDPATGNLAIHESDPLVTCSPDPTYPPDSTKCASFVSAGVTDDITITQDHDGHIAWFSEAFTSTDGQAHSLDLLWDNFQYFGGGDLEYKFPGESGYSTHGSGDAVSLPETPGTILIRGQGAADGDISTGQGAIVYDRPASEATFTNSGDDFTLHQTGMVPAGGSTMFRFAYVQDYLAANVASMAQEASTSFGNATSSLTVSKAGNGSGTVTSSPTGIDCGATCSHFYAAGTSVTLTATPATGSTFTGWSGACTGTGTCTVTTNGAISVTAHFSLIPETLTVAKVGTGSGTVTSSPAGIDCGAACSQSYDFGTSVTLTATPATDSTFSGWSGACTGTGTCTVTMNDATSVTARFNLKITATSITTPTDPSFFIADYDAASQTFAISGTSDGTTGDQVDINCYYGTTSVSVATGVSINADGSFSVPDAQLGNIEDRVCTLRAVPAGTTPSDLSPYAGPRIGVGERETSTVSGGPNDGQAFDYYLYAQQLTGAFDYSSLGDCGLFDGYLFDPTLAQTTTTFYCNAALFNEDDLSPTRSELQIDGVDAYTPDGAQVIGQSAAGLPALSYSYSVDRATGNLAIHESDPLVTCSPDPTYPPDSTKCASFVSAGVTDDITITQDHDGHIAWFSEAFTSTDGQAHTLDLLWDNNQAFGNGKTLNPIIKYQFPGESGYSTHLTADTVSLPETPGTISIRVQGAADGDTNTGQGAIVYDRPATEATFTNNSYEFTLHQTGTVPAGGSTMFRFAYVQDYLAANVASMAQEASTSFGNATSSLTVSKAGNGSGTVTSSPTGIDCGATCSHFYAAGTSVTLTATAATGSTFTGWSGACSGTGSCTVTTNDATSVTANFSLSPETLTVQRAGDGSGTVSSSPGGISCGGTCSHSFDYGSSVTLTATPGTGSKFTGWSGACSGTAACMLAMNATQSVQAAFVVKKCVVPKLKGKGLKKAKAALKTHDCSLGKVKHAFSTKVKKGHVLSQESKPNKVLAHNAKVGLVVSRGKRH